MAKAIRSILVVMVFEGFPVSLSAAEDQTTLNLVWFDHHALFRDFERVRAEADAVLDQLGVSARWEEGAKPTAVVPGALRVQVVLMPSEPSSWKLSKNAMGVVLLPDQDRSQQETVYLFYPAILRSVGYGDESGASSMLTPRERKSLARAIGRVVVHEVIHAIAPGLEHADEGLMHRALSTGDLSRRQLKVDSRSQQAFLEALEDFACARSKTGEAPE